MSWMRQAERPPRGRALRTVIVIAAVVLGGVCLAPALTVIPGLLVRHDLHGRPISTQEYLKAVADARTLILQTVGGVAVAIGAYAT
jgi:hypothetical protein